MRVVVADRDLGQLGGGGDEKIRHGHLTMVERAAGGELLEDVSRAAPDALADRDLAQRLELIAHRRELAVAAAAPEKLELHHLACRDRAGSEPCVEIGADSFSLHAVSPSAGVGELGQSPQICRRASSVN